MSKPPHETPGNEGEPQRPSEGTSQELHHSQVSARVPEKVARGVFSTGCLVAHGAHEFVLDFVQQLAKPPHLAARVILPPTVIPNFVAAIRENLARYQSTFGPLPAIQPPPPGSVSVPIEEFFDQIKVSDEVLCGAYANAALFSHSQSEFCFDFIINLYPRSVVSCRIFIGAAQVPGLLQTLTRSFQQYQQRFTGPPPKPAEPRPPEA